MCHILLDECVRHAECNGQVGTGGRQDIHQELVRVVRGKYNGANNSREYLVFVDVSFLSARLFEVTCGGEHLVGLPEQDAHSPDRAVLVRVGV